jgi:hypothetical protein
MSSSYSNLKIELIGTGDQSGTWGNTTNTNLGTAIEEAITGSVDVTFASTDVTLTLTDTNTTQQARNLRLNLTGTSGGARNLILGSGCQIEKQYIVYNGLADAVTVKNTTGTGISVPAGKSMILFNNGTNVTEVITYTTASISYPGAGIANSTGSAWGTSYTTSGSGTVLALATGASLSSPTLTTPVLGTPTSGNFSTGTFTWPTFNQNTTGTAAGLSATLVATSGGTGQSSYAIGDLLYASTTTALSKLADVATGNALISGGVGAAPSWGKVGLTTHVSGTLGISNGGTNSTATPTLGGVIVGTGSAYSSTAAGTSGYVLTSNGAAAPTWQAIPSSAAFPAGTRMSFQQTAAPTGWTKDTTAAINDSILRLVTGTASSGGSTAFSTWAAVTSTGSTTLTVSQIPSHTHSYTGNTGANGYGYAVTGGSFSADTTGATGGGSGHNHSLSQNIKYYDFIIASKD